MQEMTVRISDEIYERLNVISQKSGRSAIEHVNQAIQEHIEKLEQEFVAEIGSNDFEVEDYSFETIEELVKQYYGTGD
ncbi:MAG TPA: hypothetical protein VKN82_04655 [Desulfohalobiaceae bacterium]|nr:hypothetical protein [Desulfohalobiaceae bacterium]